MASRTILAPPTIVNAELPLYPLCRGDNAAEVQNWEASMPSEMEKKFHAAMMKI